MKCERNMSRLCCAVSLLVVEFLWTLSFSRGDSQLSCSFMERCILPCSFQGSSEVVIHWFQTEANLRVHSYYGDEDQLGLQNERFRNRTSLFRDQLSRGNASLQLMGVKVQDEGKYKCYTSTIRGNMESLITLNVDAPVYKVDLQQVGKKLTCSSEGVYPLPELTWSTSPPRSNISFSNIILQQTDEHLYNISSFVLLSNHDADLDYTCTVSTPRNWRRATFRQQASVTEGHSETIHCSPPNTPVTNLIWRFNHSQTILTQSGSDGGHTVSERWKQHVKHVSESGSLTLQDLSSDQEGTYTCELSDAEETQITNIHVKISEGHSPKNGGLIGGLIGGVLVGVIGAAGLVLYFKNKKDAEFLGITETSFPEKTTPANER